MVVYHSLELLYLCRNCAWESESLAPPWTVGFRSRLLCWPPCDISIQGVRHPSIQTLGHRAWHQTLKDKILRKTPIYILYYYAYLNYNHSYKRPQRITKAPCRQEATEVWPSAVNQSLPGLRVHSNIFKIFQNVVSAVCCVAHHSHIMIQNERPLPLFWHGTRGAMMKLLIEIG